MIYQQQQNEAELVRKLTDYTSAYRRGDIGTMISEEKCEFIKLLLTEAIVNNAEADFIEELGGIAISSNVKYRQFFGDKDTAFFVNNEMSAILTACLKICKGYNPRRLELLLIAYFPYVEMESQFE